MKERYVNWVLQYVQDLNGLRWDWGKSQVFDKENSMSKDGVEGEMWIYLGLGSS